MTFPDLPSFLLQLEKNSLLKKVDAEVDPELEITQIVNTLYAESRKTGKPAPAVLFEKVKESKFPLAINLLGSEKGIELLLDQKPEELGSQLSETFLDFQSALQKKKLLHWLWNNRNFLWKAKSAHAAQVSTAPLKEVKKFGKEINLNEFPIMKCWPLDGGKFVTAGLVITKSPKTGARNLGIYRLQVLSQNQLLLHWQIQKGGGFHYKEAEDLNRPLEVAIAIGCDPMLWLSGIMPLPEGVDELSLASFLRGIPVPIVRGETVDLEIPASAEIVIEGIAYPNKRAMEGPFGDHFGHYSHAAPFPILEIQCVTHKKNAIYHSAVVGKPPQEDRAMGETVSKMFLPIIKLMKPELANLWAYYEAGFHNLLVAGVRQRYGKEGIKTALSLLGEGQLSLSKCVVLVDPEIDVKNFSSVLKALRENFDPEDDFILLPGTAQDTLDFTGPKMNYGSKMILDATGKSQKSEVRSQKPELSFNVKSIDSRILDSKVLEETLLVVKIEGEGREVLKKLLEREELQFLKIIAVVSPDVPLEDEALVLWGIFTRFDCERDILFSKINLEGARSRCSGPMGIDATWKKNYPPPVEMTERIVAQVRRRWEEYGV